MHLPRLVLLAAAATVGGLLVPAASAAPAGEVVDAGALQAHLTASPFSLAFTDRAGRAVLAGGSLGTEAGTATEATGVHREGRALVATLRTGTPGVTLALRVAPSAEGVVAVSATSSLPTTSAVTAGFDAARDEVFTGTGERSTVVDMHGLDVVNQVSDGPYKAEDRGYDHVTTPPWAAQDRDDDTYYPVPWLLSGRGYGVLLDDDERSVFDLAKSDPDRWTALVEAPALHYRVFAGPTPAQALGRFTRDTGRQPRSDAAWVYGPWFQTGQPNTIPLAEEKGIIDVQRRADVPVSAMETQLHYLPCGAEQGKEAYERARIAQAHAAGLAILVYVNPWVCSTYAQEFQAAASQGLLQTTAGTGTPFTYPSFVGGDGDLGFTIVPLAQFDFTAPGTQAFYARTLRAIEAKGNDGWMEDFGEYTPPVAGSADGTPASQMHNRYVTDYHCTVSRIVAGLGRPVTRHQRSGWTGSAPCASIVWGGDPSEAWGFDGISSAVVQVQTIGASGIARWGTDIGGYISFGAGIDAKPAASEPEVLTPELLHRWIELGAAVPVMRTKRSGIEIPSYDRPQVFDPGTLPLWRRYTKLHTQLYPYLQAADAEYRRSGMPIVRSGLLASPHDRRAVDAHGQYLLGPDLLVAPVVAPGQRTQRVYAPAGTWVDVWRSVAFRSSDGAFLPGRPRLLPGGRTHVLPAPEDQLPLLARAGSVLPMLPADVDTLAPYAGQGLVTLADRADRLTLLAFPRGTTRSALGDAGESVRSAEGRGRWDLAVDSRTARSYTVRAALGTLTRPFPACRVLLDGAPLARSAWTYDAATSVLTATARTTRGTLSVRACARASAVARPVLPATGRPLAPVALGAALLLGAGVVLRRRA